MTGLVVACLALGGLAAVLLTTSRPAVPPLAERLAPYVGPAPPHRVGSSLPATVAPGDVALLRLRWATVAGAVAVVLGTALPLGAATAAIMTVAAPPLAVAGRHVFGRTARRRDEVTLTREIASLEEDLSIVLMGGHPLREAIVHAGTASSRVPGLAEVGGRLAHGASVDDALVEWGRRTDRGAIRRLVAILLRPATPHELAALLAADAARVRRTDRARLRRQVEQQRSAILALAVFAPAASLIAGRVVQW